jgi:hypothetical protein
MKIQVNIRWPRVIDWLVIPELNFEAAVDE